jgi:hypothetical protein
VTNAAGSTLRGDDLLLLVDFKWLMTGTGWRVDLTRWRRDECYAHECLARALGSDIDVLRERARDVLDRGRVLGTMGLCT